ncbi:MAG TPA: hypothetical protein DF383_12815, partial [Deltaproteobacteria bacterium]|nr:hypothetical protein [Deltaproteobacteria bacterium]
MYPSRSGWSENKFFWKFSERLTDLNFSFINKVAMSLHKKKEAKALQVGLREANQQFSKTMRAVKRGQEVILTERGKPLAVVKPISSSEKTDAAILRLESAGLLKAPSRRKRLPAF